MSFKKYYYIFTPMGHNPVGYLVDEHDNKYPVFFNQDDENFVDYRKYSFEDVPGLGNSISDDNESIYAWFNRLNEEHWNKVRIVF